MANINILKQYINKERIVAMVLTKCLDFVCFLYNAYFIYVKFLYHLYIKQIVLFVGFKLTSFFVWEIYQRMFWLSKEKIIALNF